MGLKNVIAEFFSAESGQERRQWLTGKEEQFGNALDYALGPDLAPRVNALAQAGAMISPGADVMEAQQAGRDMFAPDRSPLDRAASGAAMVGAGAMMLMPGGASSVRQGVESVVDAGVRAYDPSIVGSNAGNAIPEAPATPAQEIARLLSEGRANEVTDELYAQADPQELHQLYTSGATGVDMPMDTPSRMARADEMGFDTGTPLYHGGDGFGLDRSFAHGDASYHAFNGEDASEYALDRGGEDAQVAKLLSRAANTASGEDVFEAYEEASGMMRDAAGRNSWMPLNDTYSDDVRGTHQGLLNAGFDSARFDDDFTPDGDEIESIAMLRPSLLRSKFARFDPRLANLRNLSAGVAGAGAVGLAAQSRQPEERRELPPLAPELAFMKDIYR